MRPLHFLHVCTFKRNTSNPVFQVHYHIIPAPKFGVSSVAECSNSKLQASNPAVPPTKREMHQMEFELREELDDDEGALLAQKIGRGLARL